MKDWPVYTDLQTKFLQYLETVLSDSIPQPLQQAMRYSLMAGGKRLRPVCCLKACQNSGGKWQALPFAAALEMIHTYSLIHDDLPAMDNDDLRRGKPTNHVVFGEGMAVLAGDALLSEAYNLMLQTCVENVSAPHYVRAALEIGQRCGALGMVAGQCADLEAEKQGIQTQEALMYIDAHKTADLLIAALVSGAIVGGAGADEVACYREFGFNAGMAFQLTDDLLDAFGTSEELGKSIGKDAQSGKLTFLSCFGKEEALAQLDQYIAAARTAIAPVDSDGFFAQLLERIAHRRS